MPADIHSAATFSKYLENEKHKKNVWSKDKKNIGKIVKGRARIISLRCTRKYKFALQRAWKRSVSQFVSRSESAL